MYIKVGVGKSGCSGEEVALEKGGREGEGGWGEAEGSGVRVVCWAFIRWQGSARPHSISMLLSEWQV